MKYELLSKLYYKDKEIFDEEYKKRKEGGYSVSLGLDIHDNEAFFVYVPEFTSIIPKYIKSSIACVCYVQNYLKWHINHMRKTA